MKRIVILIALLLFLTVSVYGAEMSPWAETEFEKAKSKNLLPVAMENMDLREKINREEFAELSVLLYEALSGTEIQMTGENPFEDTDSQAVLKAYSAGITTGLGDGIFGPDKHLTREQAATMLARTYAKSMNKEVKIGSDVKSFADDASIEAWAKDSVYFMAENGIIRGVDEENFAPKASSTREAAIAISVRTFEALGKKPIENLRKYAPPITFGTLKDELVYEGNTAIQLTGVSEADYFNYVTQIKQRFPNQGFNYNEGFGKFYKADDGVYSVEISYVDGNSTVTIKLITSDY